MNGFNLGRYWPVMGPQATLYVPHGILRTGANEVLLLEQEKAGCSTDGASMTCQITFVDVPDIDSVVPKTKTK